VKRPILILALAVTAATLLLDQVSKEWLLGLMQANPRGLTIAPFFDLVMVWNRGISFGLFNEAGPDGQRWALIVLALVIIGVLVAWLWRATQPLLAVAIGLVIGGAIGNVIDRLRWGAVADFFSLHVGGFYWPAFNVADSAIVVGVGLLLLDSLFSGRGKR
jgi:signal peptidase II